TFLSPLAMGATLPGRLAPGIATWQYRDSRRLSLDASLDQTLD
ncbi:MAG: hypothetical protein ACI9HK_002765, partial [Pirellulaceae bacterium]